LARSQVWAKTSVVSAGSKRADSRTHIPGREVRQWRG
jgi:hypothetical protein